jgi:hypothetical protein
MLTEEFLKNNFLTAYFIDNERKNIEVQTTAEDKKSVFTTIIPYEENNPQYQALTKYMNIDQLHESTYQKNKTEQEQFEKSVLRIAEKQGLVFEFENKKLDTKFYPKILSALFEDVNNVDHIFALKLALFENKDVSQSSNDEGKKKLRQAKTKLEVLKTAIQIIEG